MSALPTRPRRRTAAPEQRRGHLRLVRSAGPRHTLRFAVLLLLLAATAVFGAVSLNALAAEKAVVAHNLEERVAEQERRYEQLLADVAALEDPARIRRIAEEELGMVPPRQVHVLRLHRTPPDDTDPQRGARAATAADPLKPILSQER